MKEENGLLNFERLRDHFVICGWKREMNAVVREILANHPALDSSMIVLVNKASHEDIDALRNDPVVKGFTTYTATLSRNATSLRAGIRTAGRVLVSVGLPDRGESSADRLQDRDGGDDHQEPQQAGLVCAEILDTKFEKYLQISHCDEILLSRQFSRSMLAFASVGVGMSAHRSRAAVAGERRTDRHRRAPESLANRTYGELCEYVTREKKGVCIGLLENTGNILTRKKEACARCRRIRISRMQSRTQNGQDAHGERPGNQSAPTVPDQKEQPGIVIAGSTTVRFRRRPMDTTADGQTPVEKFKHISLLRPSKTTIRTWEQWRHCSPLPNSRRAVSVMREGEPGDTMYIIRRNR